MLSQADDKSIYVANNDGLLEFNGANWTLYGTPNETVMRSVKAVNDRIYTGCYMDFGHWVKNERGMLQYTSLKEKLKVEMIEDEQIWNIIPHENWILFQSLSRIYLYNTSTEVVKAIESQGTITKATKVGDSLLFHVFGKGIYTIEGGQKKLVSNDPVFQENRVVGIFGTSNQWMVLTQNQGFYIIDDGNVTPWNIENMEFLKRLNIYFSTQLADGSLVLGTVSSGVVHLSNEGRILFMMDQQNGLGDNTALSLFEDQEGNIWVGLDNGIDCLNLNSPFKNYIDQSGGLGTVYASIIHKGYFYLGTNQGLFGKRAGSADGFFPISGTNSQVWCLRVIDDQLFCGHDSGTFLIDGLTSRQISNVTGTWELQKVLGREDLIIQGNYNGFNILEKKDGQWQFRNKLAGFDISARHFAQMGDNTLFVSHEYKGVYKVKTDTEYQKVLRFAQDTSVKKGASATLTKYDDMLLYANKSGVFRYDMDRDAFTRDSLFSLAFTEETYTSGKMIKDSEGRLWTFTNVDVNYFEKEKIDNEYRLRNIPIPHELREELNGYENISLLPNNTYLLGNSKGYLTIDLGQIEPKTYIISINTVVNESLKGGARDMPVTEIGEFKANQNYFSFSYSIPEFEKYLVAHYQYQLKGLRDEWSSWSDVSHVSFENLPFGDYEFRVRAKVNGQESENIASYNFTINRPWYLSSLMLALYILASIFLAAAINAAYRRYYRKQRERLLEMSRREMEIKELASQKEIIQLRNDQLRQDIEAKNRELAISTMSMIKKNEALNNIKGELKKLDEEKNVRPVIRLIDKNINNDEDWKFFEEAFNHADKDFFKKVKDLHPQLTPNDLRLCAYLRLNLSSKEIAQLLNISPRSVEIKRYRLRKKISLPRESNLSDYFLKL